MIFSSKKYQDKLYKCTRIHTNSFYAGHFDTNAVSMNTQKITRIRENVYQMNFIDTHPFLQKFYQ